MPPTLPPPLPPTRKLPRVKKLVLQALILETTQFCPPLPGRLLDRIEEMTAGEERFKVAKHLDWLVLHGYVIQHHPHGPYVPLRTPEGKPLSLLLIEEESSTHVEAADPVNVDLDWHLPPSFDPDKRPPRGQ